MSEKIAFFVQVRMGSTRLPGKVLKPVKPGLTLIEMLDARIRASKYYAKNLYYLTTSDPSDDPLAAFFEEAGWTYYRGDTCNVFNRFQAACRSFRPDYFFRICGDNPFLAPEFLDQLGDAALGAEYDYISFRDQHGTPVIRTHFGVFAELIRTNTFLSIDSATLSAGEREHVTPVFYQHGADYALHWLEVPAFLRNETFRLTVDTKEDLDLIADLTEMFDADADVSEIAAYCADHTGYAKRMKRQIERNRK